MQELSTAFGKYVFVDCGAYGLFTLESERFKPLGKVVSQSSTFFRGERPAIVPSETRVWKAIGPAIKAGRITVLDVGGYIGTFCIPLALCAKAEGIDIHIHSFEPGPTQDLLAINIAANGLSDMITLHRGAISNYYGYRIYTFKAGGSIGGNLFVPPSEDSIERVVPVCTLDTFCNGIEGPILVKLDTQGHEPRIMEAATDLISTRRATWLIEYMKWSGEADFHGEPFHRFLAREFDVFTDHAPIDDLAAFTASADSLPNRTADLLLVPKP